jgi:hypothetical protein
MDVNAPRRRTYARWSLPTALVFLAGMWGTGAARADIYVKVLSCTAQYFEAEAYDAKDAVKAVPASTSQIRGIGQTGSLHCAGEGEGYCQMTLTVGDTEGGGTIGFKLDSGKWAVVTGFNETTEEFTVERNLDSSPGCSNQ